MDITDLPETIKSADGFDDFEKNVRSMIEYRRKKPNVIIFCLLGLGLTWVVVMFLIRVIHTPSDVIWLLLAPPIVFAVAFGYCEVGALRMWNKAHAFLVRNGMPSFAAGSWLSKVGRK